MSETGGGLREWVFYLDDMIGFAEKVTAYTAGLDQDGFVSDGRFALAVQMLGVIREVACPDQVTGQIQRRTLSGNRLVGEIGLQCLANHLGFARTSLSGNSADLAVEGFGQLQREGFHGRRASGHTRLAAMQYLLPGAQTSNRVFHPSQLGRLFL